MMRTRLFIVAFLALSLTAPAAAQTFYPMLMALKPVAAQAGATTEHTVYSRYSMYGAHDVFVTGEGVTAKIIHPEPKEGDEDKQPNLQEMKIRFTVADDALLGVRDFRLATPRGASTLGQVVIVADPIVREAAKNDTPAEAQAIDVPATVCGTVEKAEDVDYFKFHAEAGTALSFHVRSMRLEDKIHDLQQHADPILTLRNASGVTLAASDNDFQGDPFIGYRFEHAGDYLLEIRDVRYQGNNYWTYSIEISDRPFVSNVFPLAVAAGASAQLELVGFNLPQKPIATLSVPGEVAAGEAWLPIALGESQSNPAPLEVSDLPLVMEVERNPLSATAGATQMGSTAGAPPEPILDNDPPEFAQAIALPAGVNGRVDRPGDVDCFAFDAKKDESYSFEVVARRQQSRLDPHLRILNADGRQLQLNDDLRLGKRTSADAWIENWTAPADGAYVIELRDLHLRGGPEFVYFLKAEHSRPYFELFADTDKTQLAPGTSGVIYVRAVRKNGFDGEIQLAVDGLPPGVSAQCGRILAGKGEDGCIVLWAEDNTAPAMKDVSIRGLATFTPDGGEPIQLEAVAEPYQETYQPGGGRGHWPVEMHSVCVAEEGDILAVTLSTDEIRLKPGESQKIDVTIERAEGFDKNVTLDVVYKHLNSVYGNSLPEGVTLDVGASKTLLTKGATEGHITLKAADNTPPAERQLVPVMANVSINFVMKATYAARPLWVSVEEK